MLLLTMVAVVTGTVTAQVIRRMTDAAALRETLNRTQAHLLEFRLFFDEPRLIWRAQTALVRDNLKLFRLLLPAALLLAIPMTWLFLQLEAAYGMRPLRAGEAALVTAQMARGDGLGDRVELRASPGIAVETPAVRVQQENQVVWRIRPGTEVSGAVQLVVNGHSVRKTVAAGYGRMLLSPRRTRSLADFLLHPEEARLPDGDVDWIAVDYPEVSPNWMIWFFAISSVAALIASRVSGRK
ncbi:MAG TPA: hypothetical protein VGL72_30375 [Bryobacteraceae bacterium]|jgi:hypothetical protein